MSSQIDVRTLGLLSNWWDESFGLIWCHHERLTSLGQGADMLVTDGNNKDDDGDYDVDDDGDDVGGDEV